MGEVLAFKPRHGRSSSPALPFATTPPTVPFVPAPPMQTSMLWSIWSDPGCWEVSRKGNPFVRIHGRYTAKGSSYCVTLFPKKGCWSWCIVRNEEPIWSPQSLMSEREAREDAWKVMEEIEAR